MDIVVANGFAMERCSFFSREYHCCVLHNTRCKCEDYNPRNSKPITNADKYFRLASDEKLAEFLEFVSSGCDYMSPDCPAHDSCKHICDQNDACRKGWLNWLKQEVTE